MVVCSLGEWGRDVLIYFAAFIDHLQDEVVAFYFNSQWIVSAILWFQNVWPAHLIGGSAAIFVVYDSKRRIFGLIGQKGPFENLTLDTGKLCYINFLTILWHFTD